MIRKSLLSGASLAAFAVAASAGSAQAFDEVYWVWNKEVTETVDIDIDIIDTFDLDGMVELEELQLLIGDVTATASLGTFENNQPAGGGGDVAGTLEILFDYTDEAGDGDTNEIDPISNVLLNNEEDTTTVDGITFTWPGPDGDNVNEGQNNGIATIDFEGTLAAVEPIDAETDLPHLEVAATAIGNHTSIESNQPVFLHEGQFVIGSLAGSSVGGDEMFGGEGNNTNLQLVEAALAGGLSGLIEPSLITADASADSVTNASIDVSATAVANNFNMNVTDENAVVIGDIVQFAYADVTATSTLSAQQLNNYTNLGVIDPVATVNATAIGNLKTITVGVPPVNGGNGNGNGNGDTEG